MNNIQNKKIVQVTDETEIVGVDVGSDSYWALALSWTEGMKSAAYQYLMRILHKCTRLPGPEFSCPIPVILNFIWARIAIFVQII